jgi:hypothetical protein
MYRFFPLSDIFRKIDCTLNSHELSSVTYFAGRFYKDVPRKIVETKEAGSKGTGCRKLSVRARYIIP